MDGIREKVNNSDLLEKVSAILFLVNEPITISKISELLNNSEIKEKDILESLNELENKLAQVGLTIIRDNSKNPRYNIVLQGHLSEVAKKIREEEISGELTPASLQVLTICAYLGTPTNDEISFIRGVRSSQSIRSLIARGLLKKVGSQYVISMEALQKLGINKINDLPEYENIKQDLKLRLSEITKSENEL